MNMFALYNIQFLVLGLIFVPALTSRRCYDEVELEGVARRKLGQQHAQPTQPAAVSEPHAPKRCPVSQYEEQGISQRSISPWRYIRDTKEDRFPRTLAVAQCLCDGCIMSNMEDGRHEHRGYNSVLVKQSRLVLRKERCADGKRYRLVPVNELVAVGCTCVRRTSWSRGHSRPPVPTLVFLCVCLYVFLSGLMS